MKHTKKPLVQNLSHKIKPGKVGRPAASIDPETDFDSQWDCDSDDLQKFRSFYEQTPEHRFFN